MRKIVFLIVLLVSFILTPLSSVQAVASSAHNIEGSSYALTDEDLGALKPILKDKEIIGVGEATHGTKEFFQMKHRMLKFIVEEMGFRSFVMEQGMAEMEQINQYIQGGTQDPTTLVNSLFKVWQCEEVLELVKWAREYNMNVPVDERVRFYGCDLQQGNTAWSNIEEYYKKIKSDSFKEIYKDYENRDSYGLKDYSRFYSAVSKDLEENKNNYIKQTSEKDYMLIKYLTDSIATSGGRTGGGDDRDKVMANNVSWIREYEEKYYSNSKMMIWAHNDHISFEEGHMGSYIKSKYGEKYYVIGQQFYNGYFMSGHMDELTRYYVDESSLNNFSGRIHEIYPDSQSLFFDVNESIKDGKIKDIFNNEVEFYAIGYGNLKDEVGIQKIVISKCYDGIIYIKTTNGANYLNVDKDTKTKTLGEKNESKASSIVLSIIEMVVIIGAVYLYDIRNKKEGSGSEEKKDESIGALLKLYCLFQLFMISLGGIKILPMLTSGGVPIILKCEYALWIILGFISLVMILNKKWLGMFLYIIGNAVGVILGPDISNIISTITCIALMGYFIYRKRKLFFNKKVANIL